MSNVQIAESIKPVLEPGIENIINISDRKFLTKSWSFIFYANLHGGEERAV